MKYWLDLFDTIDEETKTALAREGIHNSDQLLDCAAFPTERALLSAKTGIPGDTFLRIVGLADLVRVKGIGIKRAQVLINCSEIQTVQDLAQSSPEDLRSILFQSGLVDEKFGRLPSQSELAEIIEEAGELKCRLVVQSPDHFDYDMEIAELDQAEAIVDKQLRRYLAAYTVTAAILLFTFLTILHFVEDFTHWQTSDPHMTALMQMAENIWLQTSLIASFFTSVWLILMVLGLYGLWFFLTWVMRVKVRGRVIDRSSAKQTYIAFKKQQRMTEYKASLKRGAILFALFSLVSVLTVFVPSLFGIDVSVVVEYFFTSLIIVMPIFALVAIFPGVRSAWRAYKERVGKYGESAVQQVMLFNVFYALIALIWIWFIIQIGIPAAFQGYRLVYGRFYLMPQVEKLFAIYNDVNEMEPSVEDVNVHETFLIENGNRLTFGANALNFSDVDGTRWEATVIGYLSPTVGLLMVVGFVIVCVIPFILLGKVKAAILFLLLIPLSEFSEWLIEKYTSRAFQVPDGSLVAIGLIIMLFVSLTIMFDRFYQNQTQDEQVCLFCCHENPAGAKFCIQCGQPQSQSNIADALSNET